MGFTHPRLKYTAEITGITQVRRIGILRAFRCDSENPRPQTGPTRIGALQRIANCCSTNS